MEYLQRVQGFEHALSLLDGDANYRPGLVRMTLLVLSLGGQSGPGDPRGHVKCWRIEWFVGAGSKPAHKICQLIGKNQESPYTEPALRELLLD